MEILIDTLGWIGALLVLTAYYLVSTDKISGHDKRYQLLNLFGSLMLIVNTLYWLSYPSTFVNVIWAAVAIYSLVKYARKKRTD